MKKFIYTLVLLAGFQFAQAQQVGEICIVTGMGQGGSITAYSRIESYNVNLSLYPQDSNGNVSIPLLLFFQNKQNTSIPAKSLFVSRLTFNDQTWEDTADVVRLDGVDIVAKDSIGAVLSVPIIPASLFKTEVLANTICYQVKEIIPIENNQYGTSIPVNTASFCRSFSVYNIPNVSIADAGLFNAVKIFPNPVRDNNLKIENIEEATDVQIYNITGQLIQKETAVMGDVNMDVSNLSNGIYILKMQSGKNIRTEKIQIIR